MLTDERLWSQPAQNNEKEKKKQKTQTLKRRLNREEMASVNLHFCT